MKLKGVDRKPNREELPRSLFSFLHKRMEREQIEALAVKPQKLATVNKAKYPPGIASRMQHLSQYRGRSLRGQKSALMNLKIQSGYRMSKELTKPPAIPVDIPIPVVPTGIPEVPHADLMRGKALRLCFSKDEYDLYVEEWVSWFASHPDFNQREDLLDIEHICMESIIQFRTRLMMQQYPSRDYTQSYNQSFNRQQKARENLEARRVDRNREHKGPKGASGGTTINNFGGSVSVMAGQLSIADREQRAMADEKASALFLENTAPTDEPEMDDEVIDAEIEETGNGNSTNT